MIETLAFCMHGTPVKFGCVICKEAEQNVSPMVKQIQELEGRVHIMGTHISNQDSIITALFERIHTVEKDLNHIPSFDALKELQAWVDTIKANMVLPIVLETNIDNIHKRINGLETVMQEFSVRTRLMESKKPHKCPVCDGKILSEVSIQRTESGRDKLVFECHACEGTGIVWG